MRDKNEKGKDYIPFGEEWEKEMMKFSKIRLIRMLADALKELKTIHERFEWYDKLHESNKNKSGA